jgi:hypothetical protein
VRRRRDGGDAMNIYDALSAAMNANEYGAVTLGQLIDTLAAADQAHVVEDGFGEPMSWRGVYAFVGFSPVRNAVVADMLNWARSAVGATFEGYKGGDFTMTRDTPCFISSYGETGGDDAAITQERLATMVGAPVAAAKHSSLPKRPYILEAHEQATTLNGREWCVIIPDPQWDAFKAYVCELEGIVARAQEDQL